MRHGPRDRAMRAVALVIADAANRDGEHAHPGITAIIDGSLYSRASVFRALDRLIAEGWLEVEEEGVGRGHATVYRVIMEKVSSCDPPEGGKGLTTDQERSHPEPEKVSSGACAPITPTVKPNEEHNAPASAVATLDDAGVLCNELADAIAAHRVDRVRPKITAAWLNDMRLLMERGPKDADKPFTVDATRVRQAIAVVFTELNEPEGNSTFCWADQVRSAGALRRHWLKMSAAASNARKAHVGKGARTVMRTMQRAGVDPAALAGGPNLFSGELSRQPTPEEILNGSA